MIAPPRDGRNGRFIEVSPGAPDRAATPAPRWTSMIDATDILAARILVVDDDADDARLLAQALTVNGYSAVTATSDPASVREMHGRNDYDLILLDVQMPTMDGFEVMEGLKEFERDGYLPVLALTGEPGHRIRALKLGARDFLRKPVDIDELLLRVRNLVEVRLLYKERVRVILPAA
jgi:DNA-binding response OmpR family regulator